MNSKSKSSFKESFDRGFSLVEVLLAVFILGIGILSISVLFPAGIELQRQGKDAINGPLVAQQAIQTIRSKVSENDFGDLIQMATFLGANIDQWENDELTETIIPSEGRLPGDWSWRRPSLINLNNLSNNQTGTIRLFTDDQDLSYIKDIPLNFNRNISIPWNTDLGDCPEIDIAQGERCWPLANSETAPNELGSSEYFWDCLFTRKKGRVYVAVFVYRVNRLKDLGGAYAVLPNNEGSLWMPTLHELDSPWNSPELASTSFSMAATSSRAAKVVSVSGDPTISLNTWQRPDQRLVDQSARSHLVSVGKRSLNQIPSIIELKNAPKPLFDIRTGARQDDVVKSFWFVPMETPSLLVGDIEVTIGLRPIHAEVFRLSAGDTL